MLIYEPTIGTHVENAIKEMIRIANEKQQHVKANFNDIEIVVTQHSDVKTVVDEYHAEQDRRSKEYQNSPAGIAAQVKYESELAEQRLKIDELLNNLPNFESLESVVLWFEELQKCDMEWIKYRGIVELFGQHGYYPGVNCEDQFREDDKENWARWLIGQALETIELYGCVHQMYPTFAEQWREKFKEG